MPPPTQKIVLEGKFNDQMTKGVSKATGSVGKSFKGLASSVVAPIAGFLAVSALAREGLEMERLAAQLDGVSKSFKNLALQSGETADVFLTQLRTAARGTISDLELMQKANEAALLGGEQIVSRLPQLLEIARASAAATGQSVNFLFESIVLGIGRQSKLILDNLGIMTNATKANKEYAKALDIEVSSLTEAQKKQAFLNSVVASGEDIIRKTGGQIELATDKAAALTAEIDNLRASIGKKLTPAFNESRTALSFWLKQLDAVLSTNEDLEKSQNRVAVLQGDIAALDRRESRILLDQNIKRKDQIKALNNVAFARSITNSKLAEAERLVRALTRAEDDAETKPTQAGLDPAIVRAELEAQTLEAIEDRKTELQRTKQEERAEILKEIFDLNTEDRIKAIQRVAQLEVEIEIEKNDRLDELAEEAAEKEKERQLARVELVLGVADIIAGGVEAIAVSAARREANIAKSAAITGIKIAKESIGVILKIKEAEALAKALASAPNPIAAIPSLIFVKAKFAALKAIVGAASAAAIGAISPPAAPEEMAPTVGRGARGRVGRRVTAADQGGGFTQVVNLTVSALDPSQLNWDTVIQDNVAPALQRAINRNVIQIGVVN